MVKMRTNPVGVACRAAARKSRAVKAAVEEMIASACGGRREEADVLLRQAIRDAQTLQERLRELERAGVPVMLRYLFEETDGE